MRFWGIKKKEREHLGFINNFSQASNLFKDTFAYCYKDLNYNQSIEEEITGRQIVFREPRRRNFSQ